VCREVRSVCAWCDLCQLHVHEFDASPCRDRNTVVLDRCTECRPVTCPVSLRPTRTLPTVITYLQRVCGRKRIRDTSNAQAKEPNCVRGHAMMSTCIGSWKFMCGRHAATLRCRPRLRIRIHHHAKEMMADDRLSQHNDMNVHGKVLSRQSCCPLRHWPCKVIGYSLPFIDHR